MKPRIFISSTYYDLKHVRERLEKFIDNYGFEAILFESDKVTYEHNKPIDESAYQEVTLCHVQILIIGGRYGTASSSGNQLEDQNKYESEFVSITRREFETAIKRNIPVFIFIDKNVYSEYQTYKENQDFFDNNESYKNPKTSQDVKFKFAHVDNVNIFRFIDLVKVKPIKTFDRVEEIENYLQNQFAGMFYLYLDHLQKQKEVRQVLDSVTELNSISLRMNEMLNSVGKKILGNDGNHEYQEVIKKQFEMLADFFADQVLDMIDVDDVIEEISNDQRRDIAKIIYENVLNIVIQYPDKSTERGARRKYRTEYNQILIKQINDLLDNHGIPVKFTKIEAWRMNIIFNNKVKPFENGIGDKDIIISKIEEILEIVV